MRQKVITKIEEGILIILDFFTAEILYKVREDQSLNVKGVIFWFRKFEDGNYALVRHAKRGSQTIRLNEEEAVYMLATSPQAAEHKLLGFEKKGPVGDVLSKVLEDIGFEEMCIKTWDDDMLYGASMYVKSGYIPGCPNYEDEEKNWYTYEVFSDSQNYKVTAKTDAACAGCKSNTLQRGQTITCQRENITKRIKFYDGTYVFMIRTNVRTGKKIIKSIIMSKGCDRDKLARHLEDYFEMS